MGRNHGGPWRLGKEDQITFKNWNQSPISTSITIPLWLVTGNVAPVFAQVKCPPEWRPSRQGKQSRPIPGPAHTNFLPAVYLGFPQKQPRDYSRPPLLEIRGRWTNRSKWKTIGSGALARPQWWHRDPICIIGVLAGSERFQLPFPPDIAFQSPACCLRSLQLLVNY